MLIWQQIRKNGIEGSKNLIDAAKKHDVKKVIAQILPLCMNLVKD